MPLMNWLSHLTGLSKICSPLSAPYFPFPYPPLKEKFNTCSPESNVFLGKRIRPKASNPKMRQTPSIPASHSIDENLSRWTTKSGKAQLQTLTRSLLTHWVSAVQPPPNQDSEAGKGDSLGIHHPSIGLLKRAMPRP